MLPLLTGETLQGFFLRFSLANGHTAFIFLHFNVSDQQHAAPKAVVSNLSLTENMGGKKMIGRLANFQTNRINHHERVENCAYDTILTSKREQRQDTENYPRRRRPHRFPI